MDDMTTSPYPPFNGVEPYGTVRSVTDERAHRKRMCALGYRIFGALRWGMLGDGHISARDLQQGIEPFLASHGDLYRVRAMEVNTAVDAFDAMIASHGKGLRAEV